MTTVIKESPVAAMYAGIGLIGYSSGGVLGAGLLLLFVPFVLTVLEVWLTL